MGWLVSAASGLVLCLSAAFVFGVWTGHKQSWPYQQIQTTYKIFTSFVKYGEIVPDRLRMLAPPGSSREIFTIHDPDAAIGNGYYAILLWDDGADSYVVRLHDADGALIHTWLADERRLAENVDVRNYDAHAMMVLADGSVLVNFDTLGLMARIDACGDALWVNDGYFHHSFAPAADGGVWTWLGHGSSVAQLQDIVKFSVDTGEIISRISLSEDIITASAEAAVNFSMFLDFPFVPYTQHGPTPIDLFHTNDVEELMPEMAAAFPLFEAGDLLLSLRNMDMVAVIAQSGELKWYAQGPWIMQHDPDFEPDGRISVFDNSYDRPRSLIISIDPTTRSVVNAVANLDFPFKTRYRGKHQLLPNGNRLITIPEQGQAIEMVADGIVAVEINNVLSKRSEFNETLVNAQWLPPDYFERVPSCVE